MPHYSGGTYGDQGSYQHSQAWYAKLSAGYFWINNRQFYLYADKGLEVIPSGATTYKLDPTNLDYVPVLYGPVVVTYPSTADDPSTDYSSPFVMTDSEASNKYHKVMDFTGAQKEFTFDPDTAMLTFSEALPGDAGVNWEASEDDYWYRITSLDFNPEHSVYHNGIVFISDDNPIVSEIIV